MPSVVSILTDLQQLPPPRLVLHPNELAYYQRMISVQRRVEFLAGRFCGKQVLDQHGTIVWPSICIINGVFGQPVLTKNTNSMGISLAHSTQAAAAVSFPETHPMAVDIDDRERSVPDTLADQWTTTEKTFFKDADPLTVALTLWTAKEALAKVLRVGLTVPLPMLEINRFRDYVGWSVLHFTHFIQYRAICFSLPKQTLTLIVPARSELTGITSL